MDQVVRVGKIVATVGGAAWTLKSGLIMLMNSHFQPAEGILYFIGVGGLVIGALGFAAFVARRWSGAARWIGFVVVLAVALAVTGFMSSFVQTAVADVYAGTNVGIEEEMGILTPGVLWLIVGLYMVVATRSRDDAPRITT